MLGGGGGEYPQCVRRCAHRGGEQDEFDGGGDDAERILHAHSGYFTVKWNSPLALCPSSATMRHTTLYTPGGSVGTPTSCSLASLALTATLPLSTSLPC